MRVNICNQKVISKLSEIINISDVWYITLDTVSKVLDYYVTNKNNKHIALDEAYVEIIFKDNVTLLDLQVQYHNKFYHIKETDSV